jgi:hypothetical protein
MVHLRHESQNQDSHCKNGNVLWLAWNSHCSPSISFHIWAARTFLNIRTVEGRQGTWPLRLLLLTHFKEWGYRICEMQVPWYYHSLSTDILRRLPDVFLFVRRLLHWLWNVTDWKLKLLSNNSSSGYGSVLCPSPPSLGELHLKLGN